MIKKLLMIIACILVGGMLLFAAEAEEEAKTIHFLHFEHSAESRQIFEKFAKQFEELHPNITVEIEFGTAEEYFTKIATGIRGGNPPDVAQVMQEQLLALASTDNLRKLDNLVNKIGKDRFTSFKSVTYNGDIYGIPTQTVTWALWVREDRLMEKGLEPPETWSDLLDVASKLTIDEDGDGKIDQYGLALPYSTISQTSEYFIAHLWLNDWYLFDENLESALDHPRAIEVLEFYKKLKPYIPPGMATVNYAELGQTYASGLASMAFYPGRIAHHIERVDPEVGLVTKAVAPPRNRANATWIWPKMFLIPKLAENPELGEDFIEFLMRPEKIAEFSNTVPVHSIPPVKDVLNNPDFLANPMNSKYKDSIALELNILDYAVNPSMEHPGKINPYYGALTGTTIISDAVQEVMINDVAPEVALEKAAKKMNDFINKIKE